MFAHTPQCMSYLRSARPPSTAGRVHTTIATLFEIIVMLISLGPDGGATKDERSNDVSKIIYFLGQFPLFGRTPIAKSLLIETIKTQVLLPNLDFGFLLSVVSNC